MSSDVKTRLNERVSLLVIAFISVSDENVEISNYIALIRLFTAACESASVGVCVMALLWLMSILSVPFLLIIRAMSDSCGVHFNEQKFSASVPPCWVKFVILLNSEIYAEQLKATQIQQSEFGSKTAWIRQM